MTNSPLISVDENAKIGKNVKIDNFTVIHSDVEIGDGTWIGSNVTIFPGARIGKNCKIFPGAVVAGIPQDLKFKGEYTTVIIGDNTVLREYVTVSRGTAASGQTIVGENNLICAYSHVGHDSVIGNNIVISNSVQLAGHVQVDDCANIAGCSGIHQFVRIGAYTMVGSGSFVRQDVPPYILIANNPLAFSGINRVGLKRRGFSVTQMTDIKDIYMLIYRRKLNRTQALKAIDEQISESKERQTIVNFIKESQRGII